MIIPIAVVTFLSVMWYIGMYKVAGTGASSPLDCSHFVATHTFLAKVAW